MILKSDKPNNLIVDWSDPLSPNVLMEINMGDDVTDRWGNIWEQDKLIEKVDQRHIFSPLKTKIIEKCRKFISGEEHYNLVGKDYRLCLMFHGPPGNGKSKIIE